MYCLQILDKLEKTLFLFIFVTVKISHIFTVIKKSDRMSKNRREGSRIYGILWSVVSVQPFLLWSHKMYRKLCVTFYLITYRYHLFFSVTPQKKIASLRHAHLRVHVSALIDHVLITKLCDEFNMLQHFWLLLMIVPTVLLQV